MVQVIQDSIRYSEIARRNNIEGKVMIVMMISTEEQPEDIVVASTTDALLSEEALRTARMLKDWKPGRSHNRYEDLYISIPFVFRLN